MTNTLWAVELPTADLKRAISFYQSALGIKIEEMEMGGTRMGVFRGEDGAVSMLLVHGDGYVPSTNGALAYLEAGSDLTPVLDRVIANGGKKLVPKTQISPELGYFAVFADTEGNKVGLHSAK